MDCRTLGGFQACLCGTSGCSAKLLCQGREAGSVTLRLGWFQGRGWRLPRSHISYPREKISTPIMRSSVSQLFRSAYALLPADSSRSCYITISRRFPLHSTGCYFASNTPNLLIPAPFKPRVSALFTHCRSAEPPRTPRSCRSR